MDLLLFKNLKKKCAFNLSIDILTSSMMDGNI